MSTSLYFTASLRNAWNSSAHLIYTLIALCTAGLALYVSAEFGHLL